MLVLCDLDGTLVTAFDAIRLWATTLAEEHRQDATFVDWVMGQYNDGAWERKELFGAVRDRLRIEAALDELRDDFFGGILDSFRCTDETVNALRGLRAAGHAIAIVSNGEPTQIRKVEATGLPLLVDGVFISSLEGCAKPDPRLLEIAAERTGTTLTDAWMIGDSPASDIGAAAASGIKSVWLGDPAEWDRSDFRPTRFASTFAAAARAVMDEHFREG